MLIATSSIRVLQQPLESALRAAIGLMDTSCWRITAEIAALSAAKAALHPFQHRNRRIR
jgi:hypothetical protein